MKKSTMVLIDRAKRKHKKEFPVLDFDLDFVFDDSTIDEKFYQIAKLIRLIEEKK